METFNDFHIEPEHNETEKFGAKKEENQPTLKIKRVDSMKM